MPSDDQPESNSMSGCCNRRTLLIASSAAATIGVLGAGVATRKRQSRANVFVANHQRYDGSLVMTIREGLIASGLKITNLRGKRVLLKPNLVEPTREIRHMTTHPLMVLSAAEVFREWGARVVVGEGPGHVRDTQYVLDESGFSEALQAGRLEFADLNYEETAWVTNRGRVSKLDGFHFPRSVVEADLIVSMPKMKTHHWMGVTASLKNMYGVIPGIKYGWPKNVLHHAGIPETVYDINASLPAMISIVDGIDCMEGDGPIMGSLKRMGLVIIGTNPTAVDATVCRLMHVNPQQVPYLKLARNSLGPIFNHEIEQRGCDWQSQSSAFEILDRPHLRSMRATPEQLVT